MAVIGDAMVQLRPDDTGFASSLSSKIGSALSALGPIGIGAGILAGVGSALLDVGEKFQTAYNTIQQQTGATGASLTGLEKDFRNVFSTALGANFTNVSQAISELAIRTGLTGPPLDKLATQFVELAKMDPTANVQDLTAVFGQFNIAAADQSTELDVLFKAHQAAGVSIGQLTSDMKSAVPTAQILGLNLNQTAAMVAQLDKLGLPVSKTMQGLSMEFAKAAKAGRDPTAVIGSMIQQIKQAPSATAAATIAMGNFGIGARQAATLVEAVRSGFNDFGATLGQITSGKGGIDATAQATATLGERFTKFKNDALVAIEPVAAKVLEFADRIMARLPAIFDTVDRALKPIVVDLKDFGTFLETHREIMIGTLVGVGTVVGAIVIPAFIAWATAAATAAAATLVAAAPFIAIGLAAAALGVGIAYLIENWDAVWHAIQRTFDTVMDAIKSAIRAVLGWLKDNWDIILTIFTGPFGLMILVVRRFGGDIERYFDDAFNAVKRIVMGAVDAVGGFITALDTKLTSIVNWFIALPGRILGALKNAGTWLVDTGKDMIRGLANGLLNAAESLLGNIPFVGGKIVDMFKSTFGVSSPSTVFHGVGLNMMQGLANGITAGASLASGSLHGLSLTVPPVSGPAASHGLSLTVPPVSGPAASANNQVLTVLQQIRTNTDPGSPKKQQVISLLDQISTNTNPRNAANGPATVASSDAISTIPFRIAR